MPARLSVAMFVVVGMTALEGPAARATEFIPPEPRSPPLLDRTEIGPQLRSCSAEADARGEFGDVIVEIARGEVARVTATKYVSHETSRCVHAAVDRLLEAEHRAPRGQVDLQGQISDVRIGWARPFLPPPNVLAAVWERHLVAGAADVDATRKRLEAVLPADLTVGSDRCLAPVVDGEIVRQSINRSFQSIGREISPVWRFLFDDRLVPGSGGSPAFLISPTMVLWTVATPTKLCLVDVSQPEVRQHLRRRMEMLGSCWVGDLERILVAPEVAFPDDIRFRQVSVSPDGATMCGLDLDGRPHCCGRNASKYPVPPGSFEALSLLGSGGNTFDVCGIRPGPSAHSDGALECWGDLPPLARPTRLHRFVRHSACGITSSQEVACGWNVRIPVPEGTQGKVRSASWAGNLSCVLTESERIICSVGGKSRILDGRFSDLDVGAADLCATDTGGRTHCWDARTLSPVALTGPQELHDILVVNSGAGSDALCGIDSEAEVICQPLVAGRSAPFPSGNERFLKTAEGAGHICGVTKDARIRCWGDAWPPPPRDLEWLLGRWTHAWKGHGNELTWTRTSEGFRGTLDTVASDGSRLPVAVYLIQPRGHQMTLTLQRFPDAATPTAEETAAHAPARLRSGVSVPLMTFPGGVVADQALRFERRLPRGASNDDPVYVHISLVNKTLYVEQAPRTRRWIILWDRQLFTR